MKETSYKKGGKEPVENKIRELRQGKGLTQQQLAERVHVSSRTIISLEQGRYNPSLLLPTGWPSSLALRLRICIVSGKT